MASKATSSYQFLAHVKQDSTGKWHEHALVDHLKGVSLLAEQSAKPFGSSDWARLAGLWHDLGKYSHTFQHYIKSTSGYDPEAHIEGVPGRVDHSTAGAIHAVNSFGVPGRILAYLIAGHHAGLPDWDTADGGGAALLERLRKQDLLERALEGDVPYEILNQSKPITTPVGGREGFALWVRMLFSCLVDADFLDTEQFMEQEKADARGQFPDMASLLKTFERFIETKTREAESTPVNAIRAEVLRQCRAKATEGPGIFSLTVPTGGGKTLSSLAFALEHAIQHDNRRVIYVIPYTSIIEQTANVFREVFQELGELVVEHHSNLDPERETAKARLAAENWDAPIIVTTNVQFFESLFAARPSRCRKLHNIANSVVILDEAQLLPPEFLQPILDVMNLLAKYYGVTFVLSTATQPALGTLQTFGREIRGLESVREIMTDPAALHAGLKRVEIELPANFQARQTWEDVAQELTDHDSVLCIVSTRSDCRELHRLMPQETIHLSALMCGEHRSQVIADIKRRLKDGKPVRVISTQLVEAGVDVDFPVVYRALAGLDSIAQAAGRCNREGRLANGRMVVFVPPKSAPRGHLRCAEQTAVSLLTGYEGDCLDPHLFQTYFEHFYVRARSTSTISSMPLPAMQAKRKCPSAAWRRNSS